MEQYGNEHFNVERVLRENINGHEYTRRTARELATWEAVIDEIYSTVNHVEPWMSGNVRGPSTAFCLLYRLFELKITEDQVHETISCKDSPYIRAVGFLYLRYVGDPKDLLSWFEPYFADEEKFFPSGKGFGNEVTIGQYATDLLLSQNYFETIFTRIPKKVSDDIVAELKAQGLPHAPIGNGGQGGPDRRGVDDGRARPASVKASLSVAMGQRAPNRAGVTEDVSQRLARREDVSADHTRRDKGAAPSRERENDRERDRGDRGGGGARDRYEDKDRDADRHRDRDRRDGRDERHNGGGRGDGRHERYDRERPGGGGRDRGGPPDGGRSRGHPDTARKFGGRDRDDERGGRPPRPPAGNSTVFGRSAADVFGNRSAAVPIEKESGELNGHAPDDGVKIGRRRR